MSQFIEVKTAELVGQALDWAVAKATWDGDINSEFNQLFLRAFHPSTDWAQGGPLLETCNWALPYRASSRQHIGKFESCTPGGFPHNGNTPLIAACRAIVAAKMGDVVQVPAELVGVE